MENTSGDLSDNKKKPKRWGGRIWVPLGLVFIGGILFLRQLGFDFPYWFFTWPVLLIVVGIILGLSNAFRGPGWLILILVGSFFLMDQMIPGIDIHRFIWPGVLVLVGIVLLIRPKKPYWMEGDCEPWQRHEKRWRQRFENRQRRRNFQRGFGSPGSTAETGDANSGNTENRDFHTGNFSSESYIDATTILGGVHKNIISKNFKGGDITVFMGGAEINLSQADIQGTAVLDITQIMGGTKIIVPPHWEVRSQLTSFFGNIEDKRRNVTSSGTDKILIIDGSSVFGGIEIRNY